MEFITTTAAVIVGAKALAGTKVATMAHMAWTGYKASKAVGIAKIAYLHKLQMMQSAQVLDMLLKL